MKWQHLSFCVSIWEIVIRFRVENRRLDHFKPRTTSQPEKSGRWATSLNLTWRKPFSIRFRLSGHRSLKSRRNRTSERRRRFVEKKSTRRGTGAPSTHSRYRDPRTRLRGIASLERCSPRRALRVRSRACFARGAPPRPDERAGRPRERRALPRPRRVLASFR